MYLPAGDRYETMSYARTGRSGLDLPRISLGLWQNFGGAEPFENSREMVLNSFDRGVTHFDLANNYGPPAGSAELRVGKILQEDFRGHRDELIISSKAGWGMWPGPYGDWGSRKYLVASCDASLKRLGLDYVDIFYHHRPDPHTPLEETLGALDHLVRTGKALYVGISSYPAERTTEAMQVCAANGFVKPIIHQPSYSMLDRWIEDGVIETCGNEGVGIIPFCPLAQGLLTNKYLQGIPEDSRAASKDGFLKADRVTPGLQAKLGKLNDLAQQRGQTLAQLALSWVLRDGRVTSALIGASRPNQIRDCAKAVDAPALSQDQLRDIETILAD